LVLPELAQICHLSSVVFEAQVFGPLTVRVSVLLICLAMV
jgi:hypothetical protein